MASIDFDDTGWPLLQITFQSSPTDEEFEAYLRRYDDDYICRDQRYALALITAPGLPMAKTSHARMQANWIAERTPVIERLCCGLAFVLPSPLQRGVVRALLSMQGLPCPYKTFSTFPEAEPWLNERLAEGLQQAGGA